jgi:hemolysin activation/secretion protein
VKPSLRVFALALLGTLHAGAATVAVAQALPVVRPEQDPAERLLKEQRERERELQLNQAPPQIAAPKADRAAAVPLAVDTESVPETGPTFQIDHIELTGNTVLTPADVERLSKPFLGHRLGVNRINLLLRRLTEAFIAKGFITTRAYLGEQTLASGTLILTVVPGKIESFQINGQTVRSLIPAQVVSDGPYGGGWLTDAGTLAAFPATVGDTLNLQDLEQGVDQINRLRRNQAELQILPGQTAGGSVVALNNKSGDRYRVNLGLDNYGSKATGTTRTRIGADLDNPFGLQEALSFAYVGSLDTNALLASASVPYGYNTFSYTASYSEFQNLIGDTALLFGRSVGHALGWNRVLSRSREQKSSVDLSLSARKVEREINNILLMPQRLSVARLAWNQLSRFASIEHSQGSWTVELGLSRGLKAVAANADAADLAYSDAHSQFNKLDLSATLDLPLTASWHYRGSFNGQWSRVGLFSSEQIFLGGVGSVRGFTEGGVSGDRGFYVRNEVQWMKAPHPQILSGPLLLQPYLFVDAGRAELLSQGQWKQLAGAGLGTRAQWQSGAHQVIADLQVGCALQQSAELGSKATVAQASLNWIF